MTTSNDKEHIMPRRPYALSAEAMSLVLWRAADCGVNGVSDAVYKSKLPSAKSTTRPLTGMWVGMTLLPSRIIL